MERPLPTSSELKSLAATQSSFRDRFMKVWRNPLGQRGESRTMESCNPVTIAATVSVRLPIKLPLVTIMRTPVSQFVSNSITIEKSSRSAQSQSVPNNKKTSLRKTYSKSNFLKDDGTRKELHCYDCDADFTSEPALLNHLIHHVKQPSVQLNKVVPCPATSIKITLKATDSVNFKIISPPPIATPIVNTESSPQPPEEDVQSEQENSSEENTNTDTISNESGHFSPNFTNVNGVSSISIDEVGVASPASSGGGGGGGGGAHTSGPETNRGTPDTIPGAEPTPPPEPSPNGGYPKIRIKTTGLLKESLTITEIIDDDPNGDCRSPENNANSNQAGNFWETPSLEDPLKLVPDRDDNILTNILNNNNDQAKAFGISSSDNEFISLDRMEDANRNALQMYNPATSSANPLENLTGLPMQQLAEQVSRLQPPGGSGMHQQNVLINIQQFPQPPPPQPPHGYQHPPMFSLPSHPVMGGQPMYQPPYQYQPPPMFYQPPSFGPNPHPRHPISQAPPPPMSQAPPPPRQMPPPQQPPQYRPRMPNNPSGPRQFTPQRGPAPRQPILMRQRTPATRLRGGLAPGVRGPRPRLASTPFMNASLQNNHQRMAKRSPEQMQSLQAKKKRMDVLVPDKNDDADCQVIAVQPKNTDGGLPQIQSVQGGQSDSIENIVHLPDSITLSVRNPPVRPASPKKSDAKTVANILATRGITVTASAKTKERNSPPKETGGVQAAINLNGAVTIIPTPKSNNHPTPNKSMQVSSLPTVDLTDDSPPKPTGKPIVRTTLLPFRCDLCPAQYPNSVALTKHRHSYHKTGNPCEIGLPLVDLRQPGVVQKLSSLGIYNFVPLSDGTPGGTFALPVISMNAAKNSAVCNLSALGATSILNLGPVRSLSKNSK